MSFNHSPLQERMEKKFIAAVRKGNDALVRELGPNISKDVIEDALEIAELMNVDNDYDSLVEILRELMTS